MTSPEQVAALLAARQAAEDQVADAPPSPAELAVLSERFGLAVAEPDELVIIVREDCISPPTLVPGDTFESYLEKMKASGKDWREFERNPGAYWDTRR